jgi:hypothetical protein
MIILRLLPLLILALQSLSAYAEDFTAPDLFEISGKVEKNLDMQAYVLYTPTHSRAGCGWINPFAMKWMESDKYMYLTVTRTRDGGFEIKGDINKDADGYCGWIPTDVQIQLSPKGERNNTRYIFLHLAHSFFGYASFPSAERLNSIECTNEQSSGRRYFNCDANIMTNGYMNFDLSEVRSISDLDIRMKR